MSDLLSKFIDHLYNLMCAEGADEVLVNGVRGVFVTCSHGTKAVDALPETIGESADLVRLLARRVGLRLDARQPACGGTIDHLNLRWHAIVSPVAQDEIVFSMRRHRFDELSLECFDMSAKQRDVISAAVQARQPVLVSGPTGVGKTSFLASILKQWHIDKRVVIIESVAELPPLSPTWIRLTEAVTQVSGHGGFSLRAVAQETLRMRPEVLVVGELRGSEAEVFLDMSLSGHGGCFATIHAQSPKAAVARLRHMAPGATRYLSEDFCCTVVQLERSHLGRIKVSHVESAWVGDQTSKVGFSGTASPHSLEHGHEVYVQ